MSQIKDRHVLVSIAFNDLQTILWQTALVRHFVKDVVYVIADNTPDDRIADEISRSAKASNVFYIRLPLNPSHSPSRSHGLALNWVWENVIKPGEPQAFGFLDDDIYPTAPDDPFAALTTQSFYGVVRPGLPIATSQPIQRWFLWAGFCVFLYSAFRNADLDFSQDWFVGLDTGGANWEIIYRHFDRSSIREQPTRFVPYRDGVSVADGPIQWCGTWLHAVGLMGTSEHSEEKFKAIAKILEPHLNSAASASSP